MKLDWDIAARPENSINVADMNTTRIDQCFAELKSQGRAALVTFITAGDPDSVTSLAKLSDVGCKITVVKIPAIGLRYRRTFAHLQLRPPELIPVERWQEAVEDGRRFFLVRLFGLPDSPPSSAAAA